MLNTPCTPSQQASEQVVVNQASQIQQQSGKLKENLAMIKLDTCYFNAIFENYLFKCQANQRPFHVGRRKYYLVWKL